MKKSLLKQSLQIAVNKLLFHPEYDKYIHYSFIVQGNKIIEWGMNNAKTPPIHHGYQSRMKNLDFSAKTHAEPEAFRKARGLLDLRKPFDMINIRLNKAGELRISKPCVCCYNLLKSLGCHKFYYSCDLGFMELV